MFKILILTVKRYLVMLISSLLLLSACSQPMIYNGDKFPKTKAVDVYYSAKDIKRSYKVIGHIKAHKYSNDIVKVDLTRFGKSIGADAVIVLGVDSIGKGSHI